MYETIFSSQAFAEAWCARFGPNLRPLRINDAYAVATQGRSGLSSVAFAPEGFYGGPHGQLGSQQIDEILEQLQRRTVRRFVWNVRFDHQAIAAELEQRIPEFERFTTQVLTLGATHEDTFRNYNATIRNQIRKAKKTGVTVREGDAEQDLAQYYEIHLRHISRKGGFEFVYPLEFLRDLLQPAIGGRLLIAIADEKIVAGGIFLPDGDSVYYFHGAYDHDYSKQFPTCAVIDEAIEWAHKREVLTFNFGGSGELDSLKRFKSFWGTQTVDTWRFTWRNPLWDKFDGATQWIRKLAFSR